MPGKGNNKSSRSKRGQYEVVQATPLEYRPAPQPELPDYFDWHAFTVEFWDSLKEHPTLQNLTKTQWQFFILSVIMPIELAEHTQKAPTPRHVEGNATYGELRLEA